MQTSLQFLPERLKAICESRIFRTAIIVFIILAGILVGLETYPALHLRYRVFFSLLDRTILVVFIGEILIKIGAEGGNPWKFFTNREHGAWNTFDFIIVALCLVPLFIEANANTAFFAVLRLVRILRVLRLVTALPRLQFLVTALLRSLPPMAYVALMLLLHFYVYAVMATFLFASSEPVSFGSLQHSMLSLFYVVTGSGWAEHMEAQSQAGNSIIAALFFISFVVIGGMIILNLFIGVITSEMADMKSEEEKGRTKIEASNHTIILGWSQQIFTIIQELILANESVKHPVIVILANRDKSDMEEEIASKIQEKKNTRILCRTGDSLEFHDLDIVSPQSARAIILLSPEDKNDPDSSVIKTLLAIVKNPHHKKDVYNIIAEIRNPDNMDVARLAGGQHVTLLCMDELISRIVAQTCVHTGLSLVYSELLSFAGSEIYFHEEPTLTGKKFEEIFFAYATSVVIGIKKHLGAPEGSKMYLNPLPEMLIEPGDQLIIIAEDDSKIKLAPYFVPYHIQESTIASRAHTDVSLATQRLLILGWNRRSRIIITEIANYLHKNSEIVVVASHETASMVIQAMSSLLQVKISFQHGETTNRTLLDSLNCGQYNHIIILNNSDELSHQESDAQTLITLLHLRDIAKKSNQSFSIVSEILDVKNRALASVNDHDNPVIRQAESHTAQVSKNEDLQDDFIISKQIDSQLIAQVSENKDILVVYQELFSNKGCEICLIPAEDYVQTVPVNFHTVMEAALVWKEIAIGYRIGGKYVINPSKDKPVKFSKDDKVIVLARAQKNLVGADTHTAQLSPGEKISI